MTLRPRCEVSCDWCGKTVLCPRGTTCDSYYKTFPKGWIKYPDDNHFCSETCWSRNKRFDETGNAKLLKTYQKIGPYNKVSE